MRKFSVWAKNHKAAARIIIVCSHIVLALLGIITGNLLKETGIIFSSMMLLFLVFIFLIAVLMYPSRSLKGKKISAAYYYVRQKSCDLLLAACSLCFFIYFSNRPSEIFNYYAPLNAATSAPASFPKDSTTKNYKSIAAFSASLKNENGRSLKWKEKKQLLKTQIKAIKADKTISKGAQVALIILSVVVALGLIALVSALACNLSCNGSATAAALLFAGGTGLTIFLLIIAIRAITGKKRKPKKPANSDKHTESGI